MHVDVQIAFPGSIQCAGRRHNVAEIPGLDILDGLFTQLLPIEVKLNRAGTILNQEKRAAIANQPPRH